MGDVFLCCFVATTLGTRITPQSCSKCMLSSFRAILTGLASPPLLSKASGHFAKFSRLAMLAASRGHCIFITHKIYP